MQELPFNISSKFKPKGDQINAIKQLTQDLKNNKKNNILLGVTGSGKTFTMANLIHNLQKPSLIFAHNKTLAAQLYGEMKEFFPDNAVEFFVSYYDYYQPEAYVPRTDTYIEKDASINEHIDQLRHSATRSLFERKDVIIIASVSCIYGLGSPDSYSKMTIDIEKSSQISMNHLLNQLVELQYERNDLNFLRGKIRVRGDTLDLFPANFDDKAYRFSFFGDEIEKIHLFDPITGNKIEEINRVKIYANSHYITPKPTLDKSIKLIQNELDERLKYLKGNNQIIEAARLEQKTNFDIEMIEQTGSCKGIENYSRYLSGRAAGQPPPTLFEYFPSDSLIFIDESHVTIPQIRAMYNGDRARKTTLVEHGFRLPSALDNRPLKFDEWDNIRSNSIFVSATPGKFELELTDNQYVEQIIRPTGLLDPECFVRPTKNQIDDLTTSIDKVIKKNYRILITTLTKKMAENLSNYLLERKYKAIYMHSEIKTLERVEIIQSLRNGKYDILVGVNLLREGLDIPECGLVAILDADKEGFLRSETSLTQTIGRAARNSEGYVILYADKITNSMQNALNETNKRREKQLKYNQENNIKPQTIRKDVFNFMNAFSDESDDSSNQENNNFNLKKANLSKMRKEMLKHAANLDFEKASEIRDQINYIEKMQLL